MSKQDRYYYIFAYGVSIVLSTTLIIIALILQMPPNTPLINYGSLTHSPSIQTPLSDMIGFVGIACVPTGLIISAIANRNYQRNRYLDGTTTYVRRREKR